MGDARPKSNNTNTQTLQKKNTKMASMTFAKKMNLAPRAATRFAPVARVNRVVVRAAPEPEQVAPESPAGRGRAGVPRPPRLLHPGGGRGGGERRAAAAPPVSR